MEQNRKGGKENDKRIEMNYTHVIHIPHKEYNHYVLQVCTNKK